MGALARKVAAPAHRKLRAVSTEPVLTVLISIENDADHLSTWDTVTAIAAKRAWSISEVVERALHEGIRGKQRAFDRTEMLRCGVVRVVKAACAVAVFSERELLELKAIAQLFWSENFPEGITDPKELAFHSGHETTYEPEQIVVEAMAIGLDALAWSVLGAVHHDADSQFGLAT